MKLSKDMKNLILITGLALSGLVLSMQYSKSTKTEIPAETGIQFQTGSFSETLALAKKENKIVFVDIYASWCGPCKRLKSTTFSDANVGEYFNSNFVNAAFDGEKGEGIELAQKYGVTAYPTLLFIHPDGTVKGKSMGYYNAADFITLGKQMK